MGTWQFFLNISLNKKLCKEILQTCFLHFSPLDRENTLITNKMESYKEMSYLVKLMSNLHSQGSISLQIMQKCLL